MSVTRPLVAVGTRRLVRQQWGDCVRLRLRGYADRLRIAGVNVSVLDRADPIRAPITGAAAPRLLDELASAALELQAAARATLPR